MNRKDEMGSELVRTNSEVSRGSKSEFNDYNTDSGITFKIMLLGETYCGKSSIANRYSTNDYSNEYEPTTHVDVLSNITIYEYKNTCIPINLQIWDTPGQLKCNSNRKFYELASCAIIVFDVTNTKSLTDIKKWYIDFVTVNQSDPLIFVVGNKVDSVRSNNLKIPQEQILREVRLITDIPYIEISAKKNVGVDNLFTLITAELANKNKDRLDEFIEAKYNRECKCIIL